MFASKTLVEHVLRGAVGIGSFAVSAAVAESHPLVALCLIFVALLALRGCPMCWTLGLAQIVAGKVRGIDAPNACVDGQCLEARWSAKR